LGPMLNDSHSEHAGFGGSARGRAAQRSTTNALRLRRLLLAHGGLPHEGSPGYYLLQLRLRYARPSRQWPVRIPEPPA